MPVPQEFSHLAECFYSRSDLEYASAEEWVHATVRDTMSDKQRAVVRRYLAELLSGPASDADLMKIWNGLESDYWIEEPRGARALFRAIAAALGDQYSFGISPLEAAVTAIDLHNTAAANKALLDNSARPSGALVYTAHDGNLTTEPPVMPEACK